jgi:hypothetical protein
MVRIFECKTSLTDEREKGRKRERERER